MRYLAAIVQKIDTVIKNTKTFMVCARDFVTDAKIFAREAAAYSIPQAVQVAVVVVLSVNAETLYRNARDGVFIEKLIRGVAQGHFLHPIFWF